MIRRLLNSTFPRACNIQWNSYTLQKEQFPLKRNAEIIWVIPMYWYLKISTLGTGRKSWDVLILLILTSAQCQPEKKQAKNSQLLPEELRAWAMPSDTPIFKANTKERASKWAPYYYIGTKNQVLIGIEAFRHSYPNKDQQHAHSALPGQGLIVYFSTCLRLCFYQTVHLNTQWDPPVWDIDEFNTTMRATSKNNDNDFDNHKGLRVYQNLVGMVKKKKKHRCV